MKIRILETAWAGRFSRGGFRLFPLAVTALVLTAVAVAAWGWLRHVNADRLEVYGAVPDFSLVERSGRTVTRAALLRKVSVVDFFYTRCPDTCPLQSAHLARLQAELSGVPDVLLVSITLDPDHDTRAVLSEYAARFRAEPSRWLFLTGPREAIYRLAVDGFHLAATASHHAVPESRWAWLRPASAWAQEQQAGPKIIQLVHGSRFALVDRQARIRGYFDGTDWESIEQLQEDLTWLLGSKSR